MTKHRSTKITEFLDAVIPTPALLDEYFQKYNISLKLKESSAPLSMVTDYLDNLADTDLKDSIEEEIARLYDIAKTMTGFIPDVIQKYQIAIRPDEHTFGRATGKENQHQLILHIFLYSKTAYNRLNDYYLFYGAGNKMSCHKMECNNLVITQEKMDQFKEQVKAWYQSRQQGKDCIIRHYEENGGLIIVIIRGKMKKHQLVLKDEDEKVNTETIFFRPAHEDILQYDKNKSSLLVGTSLRKDRENYISALIVCASVLINFSVCISGHKLINGKLTFHFPSEDSVANNVLVVNLKYPENDKRLFGIEFGENKNIDFDVLYELLIAAKMHSLPDKELYIKIMPDEKVSFQSVISAVNVCQKAGIDSIIGDINLLNPKVIKSIPPEGFIGYIKSVGITGVIMFLIGFISLFAAIKYLFDTRLNNFYSGKAINEIKEFAKIFNIKKLWNFAVTNAIYSAEYWFVLLLKLNRRRILN